MSDRSQYLLDRDDTSSLRLVLYYKLSSWKAPEVVFTLWIIYNWNFYCAIQREEAIRGNPCDEPEPKKKKV
jgi:hypothetical protein